MPDNDIRAVDLIAEASHMRLSRREIIKRGLAMGLSIPTIGWVLAACGSSNKATTNDWKQWWHRLDRDLGRWGNHGDEQSFGHASEQWQLVSLGVRDSGHWWNADQRRNLYRALRRHDRGLRSAVGL